MQMISCSSCNFVNVEDDIVPSPPEAPTRAKFKKLSVPNQDNSFDTTLSPSQEQLPPERPMRPHSRNVHRNSLQMRQNQTKGWHSINGTHVKTSSKSSNMRPGNPIPDSSTTDTWNNWTRSLQYPQGSQESIVNVPINQRRPSSRSIVKSRGDFIVNVKSRERAYEAMRMEYSILEGKSEALMRENWRLKDKNRVLKAENALLKTQMKYPPDEVSSKLEVENRALKDKNERLKLRMKYPPNPLFWSTKCLFDLRHLKLFKLLSSIIVIFQIYYPVRNLLITPSGHRPQLLIFSLLSWFTLSKLWCDSVISDFWYHLPQKTEKNGSVWLQIQIWRSSKKKPNPSKKS